MKQAWDGNETCRQLVGSQDPCHRPEKLFLQQIISETKPKISPPKFEKKIKTSRNDTKKLLQIFVKSIEYYYGKTRRNWTVSRQPIDALVRVLRNTLSASLRMVIL